MQVSTTEIQRPVVDYLERNRLVGGWLSVEVGPLEQRDGIYEGELFLSRRFQDGVRDADLDGVRGELDRAFAAGEITIDGVRKVELREVSDGFFNERAHPQLGTVRTLAAWLIVTPE